MDDREAMTGTEESVHSSNSLVDLSALEKLWKTDGKGRTTLVYLLSSFIGGLLEGVVYLSFRLSGTLDTSTSTLSYYSTVYSVVTLLAFFVVLDSSLYPNVATAFSVLVNGLMFFVLPITLLSESDAERYLSGGNIALLILFYIAYGVANGGLYVLAPVFLRKLYHDDVNLGSSYLGYSGSFQALGVAFVTIFDVLFGLFMPNLGLVALVYFSCGFAFFAYAYILLWNHRESSNEMKIIYRSRKKALGRQPLAGDSGSFASIGVGRGSRDLLSADLEREFPAGFSADKLHFKVESILFWVEIFRAGSFATTITYMFLFCDESYYVFLDADNYVKYFVVAIVCFLVGKVMGPFAQEWWGGTREVYAALMAISTLSALLFLPFLIFEALQNGVYFMFAIGLYSFLQGPSYALLLDLNNRLTFESNRSSTILIVANILGFLYPNFVSTIYSLTPTFTDIFIYNIVLCAIVTGVLTAMAPGSSYLDLQKVGLGDSTPEERRPIVQGSGSEADAGAGAEDNEEPEEAEEAEPVDETVTEGIV